MSYILCGRTNSPREKKAGSINRVPFISSGGGEQDLLRWSGDVEVPQTASVGPHRWAGFDGAAAGRTRLDLAFVFSPRRRGRRNPSSSLSFREMLLIYAMLPLLLSKAWGRETGMNLNIISVTFHLHIK